MGKHVNPPPTPNFGQTAQQQGAANLEAARASGQMSNPNVNTPYGSQTVTWEGNQPTINQTLTPTGQQTVEQQQQTELGLAQIANQQQGQIGNLLNTPFSFGGTPQQSLGNVPSASLGPNPGGYQQYGGPGAQAPNLQNYGSAAVIDRNRLGGINYGQQFQAPNLQTGLNWGATGGNMGGQAQGRQGGGNLTMQRYNQQVAPGGMSSAQQGTPASSPVPAPALPPRNPKNNLDYYYSRNPQLASQLDQAMTSGDNDAMTRIIQQFQQGPSSYGTPEAASAAAPQVAAPTGNGAGSNAMPVDPSMSGDLTMQRYAQGGGQAQPWNTNTPGGPQKTFMSPMGGNGSPGSMPDLSAFKGGPQQDFSNSGAMTGYMPTQPQQQQQQPQMGGYQGMGGGPAAQMGLNESGVAQMPINAGTTAQQAIMSRLDPQLQRQRTSTETQLINQGLRPGGEAYNNAATLLGQQENDQRTQAALQGLNLDMSANQQGFGQALTRGQFANQGVGQNFQQALQSGQFGNEAQLAAFGAQLQGQAAQNAAQQQGFGQEQGLTNSWNQMVGQNQQAALAQQQAQLMGTGAQNAATQQNYQNLLQGQQAWNQGQAQQFGQALQGAQFGNAAQQQALQQVLQQRQIPINEIAALMSGSQIQNPQFGAFQGQTVAPTPVMQGAQNQSQWEQNLYNQQIAQKNALTSGLFGLGGAALSAFMPTGRR